MIKQESSIWIDRPPEAIWEVIADPMSYPKWDPGLLEVTPTSPGAPRVGSTFRAAQMLMGRRTALSIEITEVETYKRAAWMVTADIAEVFARYTLEPEGGGTRVHRYVEAKLKGPWKLLEPLMNFSGQRPQRRKIPEELEKLKHLVEVPA